MRTTKVAVIGSGNIGSDLMVKVGRSRLLEMACLAGIDPRSDGLARARQRGIPATSDGVRGLIEHDCFPEVEIVFDATSAAVHLANAAVLAPYGKQLIDLTPAALGPQVVPPVNLEQLLAGGDVTNVNMVTCGGQATISVVAAVSRVTPVRYAEIVASIASRSAGPGTRANTDEFTATTASAIESIGGAERGKAIIVLNPADPPLIMRDTVLCAIDDVSAATQAAIRASVADIVRDVAAYAPGYRLKQPVQLTPLDQPGSGDRPPGSCQVSVFLEVEGAADYLPSYAGNLDIMTSAAIRVAERLALRTRGMARR